MDTITSRAIGSAPRLRCLLVVAFVLILAAAPRTIVGDQPDANSNEPAAAAVELVVDPAAEPIPALKYHLLPPMEELRLGNAAPIYLRVTYEQGDEWRRMLDDEPRRLLDLPRDELPLEEVGKLLESFSDMTDQMRAASYRSDCNWEYVTENRNPLMILLPDAQSMREFGRLLALKARYEIQTGDLPSAVATLQDGFALCRHVARAPFLVNQLVGSAIADLILGEVEAFVASPGSENLYWALAVLPRPFISYETGLATERQLLQMRFPELADMNQARSVEDWQRLSRAMRNWAGEIFAMEHGSNPFTQLLKRAAKTATPEQIEMAARYLQDKMRLPAEAVAAMSPAEVEVRYTVALYAEISDSWQKWIYLPYSQSLGNFKQQIESIKAEARRRELYPLVSELTAGANVLPAQARVDRGVARLGAIEALRMHAASTDELPAKLDDVTIVPVPNDPATGAPFLYTRDNDGAVLDIADERARASLRMPVRIRLRGK